MNVRPRELFLLFRRYEVGCLTANYRFCKRNIILLGLFQGYESSLLKITGKIGKAVSVSFGTIVQ